ncbi:hypothetical protein L2E82_36247 [Cichorium intybus]|uniref:Uncharacterized protein n=1 Tax=Cichorium intybus TaxID=13427 RepID=A0ACB9BR51_CICIN|nr:hypothetical protein L2E82_36247 [Cichorium intybus]
MNVVFNINKLQDKYARQLYTSSTLAREPKDVLISKWLFMRKLREKDLSRLSLDEAFDLFYQGILDYGTFWEHVLSYWRRASLDSPEKNVLEIRGSEEAAGGGGEEVGGVHGCAFNGGGSQEKGGGEYCEPM